MKATKNPFDANPLFGSMPLELTENLKSLNPWWQGQPAALLPTFRRWPFKRLKHLLNKGMTPAAVLRGPRRVGKTVLLKQIIQDLLAEGVSPQRILYVPFDELSTLAGFKEPVLAIARWHQKDILGATYNSLAHQGTPSFLFLDEVQNLDGWAPQIKNLVDNHSVRVLVTGSSSFRIEAGRDSLAGRITTLDIGPLLLREIAELRFGHVLTPFWGDNGFDSLLKADYWRAAVAHGAKERAQRQQAFKAYSERGGYPIAQEKPSTPWPELADYLNETVIKRAIQHDLRTGKRGQKRDEKLLEEVFRLCCRYTGQTPGQNLFLPEIQQALKGNIGWNRILTYLRFLDGTLLVRLIQPLEIRLKRRKSPAKICICDPSLRASWLEEIIPLDPEALQSDPQLSDLAGRLAESVLGYFLASVPNLDVAHFPARGAEPEVDFVMTVGTKRIPVEVKYRKHIDSHEDTVGLRAFLEKTVYNAPFGLLVTLDDQVSIPDPRIIAIPLSSFLWLK
jgi:predicted AAA+ superfamily ATPase